MARSPSIDKLSYSELMELRAEVEGLIASRQADEKQALRQKLTEMARAQGFELGDVIGTAKRPRGTVAIKYRDPDNPENTWTGRGRMPRWMVAATKRRGVKKEDFLI